MQKPNEPLTAKILAIHEMGQTRAKEALRAVVWKATQTFLRSVANSVELRRVPFCVGPIPEASPTFSVLWRRVAKALRTRPTAH